MMPDFFVCLTPFDAVVSTAFVFALGLYVGMKISDDEVRRDPRSFPRRVTIAMLESTRELQDFVSRRNSTAPAPATPGGEYFMPPGSPGFPGGQNYPRY
jgi:hypothetical protein